MKIKIPYVVVTCIKGHEVNDIPAESAGVSND